MCVCACVCAEGTCPKRVTRVIILRLMEPKKKNPTKHVRALVYTNLRDHTALLEEVMLDVSTDHKGALVEVQLDELSETGRVVVASCFRVTERLEERVRSQNAGLKFRHVTALAIRIREVSEEMLGGLCLTSAGLARAHDALAQAQVAHVTVRLVGYMTGRSVA